MCYYPSEEDEGRKKEELKEGWFFIEMHTNARK